MNRHFTLSDHVTLSIDQVLRTLFNNPITTERPYPASDVKEGQLTKEQKKHSAALMRINHAGEVCAQALYHGQRLASTNKNLRDKIQQAAIEEGDHLAWCQKRLIELESHSSYLNPFWYMSSLGLGLVAGWIGDQWSLGFLAETEKQVVIHLEKHLKTMSAYDNRSKKILEQMQQDEAHHRDEATILGGVPLPKMVQKGMTLLSKVMVKVSYYI